MSERAQIAALCVAALLLPAAHTALAEELAGAAPLPQPRPEIIQVSDKGCQVLTRHVPDEDVAYQPGVSVTGKPVAGADLNPSPYALRPVYQFDIEIVPGTLNEKYRDATGLAVATITYEPETGKVLLDGQELEGLHEAALRSACARKPGKPPVNRR